MCFRSAQTVKPEACGFFSFFSFRKEKDSVSPLQKEEENVLFSVRKKGHVPLFPREKPSLGETFPHKFIRRRSTANPGRLLQSRIPRHILSNMCRFDRTNFLAQTGKIVIIIPKNRFLKQKETVRHKALPETVSQKGSFMNQNESCVILTAQNQNGDISNTYRLIKTADPLSCEWIYSVFASTEKAGKIDEEFAYDIARDDDHARYLFLLLCEENVTACTLHDVLHNLIAEPLTLP